MKAWIYISAVVFAAGMLLTALADETNTNPQTGATRSAPAVTNAVAVQPPIVITSTPAPAAVNNVKPPAGAPAMQTSTVPAQPNLPTAPLTTTSVMPPPAMVITSTPAPVVTNEVKPPDEVSLMQTSAVPTQPEITTEPLTTTNAVAPPPESPKTGHKGILAFSVVVLAVVGGLTAFMLRSSRKPDHASLITRAMNENKDEDKDTNKPAEKHEDKPEAKKPEKKEEKESPPPAA